MNLQSEGLSVKAILLFGLLLAMAAAGCSKQSGNSSGAQSNDALAASDTPSIAVANGQRGAATTQVGTEASRTITLIGFSCGDSCYLEFTDDGEAKTALCRTTQCSDWADRRALPPTLKGKRATARFGMGNQVDAADNVMSRDYPTVEELRILGHSAETSARSAQVGSTAAGQRATDGATGALGLITGVYTSGDDCGSIANAGLRIYDGVGLSGSATRNCRTEVLSRSGQTYKIASDCAATYNGKRSTQKFTVRVSGSRRFTLSDGESGTYNYCPVGQLDPVMRQYVSDANPPQDRDSQASTNEPDSPARNPGDGTAAAKPTVPARFRGLFAVDRKACEQDYSYNPAFQNVTVEARSVRFFETGGPITDVNIQGDMAAITLRETVGDKEFTRAIYLALNRDGTVRYRPGRSEPSRTYVRCGA